MESTTIPQQHTEQKPTNAGSFSDLLRKVQHPTNEEPQAPYHWTLDEKVQLYRLAAQGKTRKEIAGVLGRSTDSVYSMASKLGVVSLKGMPQSEVDYVLNYYPLFGEKALAEKLRRPRKKIKYIAQSNDVKYKSMDKYNPPIPRGLTCYDMVKRVSFLDRESPVSQDLVEDCVAVFYNKTGPSAPLIAMHVDELVTALANHFSCDPQALTLTLLSGDKHSLNRRITA